MNIATIIGIIFGVGILVAATVFSTSSVGVFVDPHGLAIVLGGTIAATFICYPLREVMRVFSVFLLALKREELPIGNTIRELVYWAKEATVRGQINLEKKVETIENEFLRHSIQMLVDGYGKDEIREILDTRIQQYYEQEMSAAGIFRTMARFAPAFGLVGTLIGLISMMQAMGSDAAGLGRAMATALTTTLYGVVTANLFCLPIAVKVEKRVEEIVLFMSVIRDGVLLIKDKTPAPIVMDKLKAYLPPRRWASIAARSDAKGAKAAPTTKSQAA